MKKFFNNVLSSLLGTIIALAFFSMVVFGISIGLISSLSSSFSDETEITHKTNILHLKLNRRIVEKGDDNPLRELGIPLDGFEEQLGLVELIDMLDEASNDNDIDAVLMELSVVPAGYAVAEEIRNALADFKEKSGKKIYAYSESMTEKAYFIASVADEIYVPSSGMIEFKGLRSEIMFYKGLLEKLELEPKIFRVGKYKGAVEPFMREDMSDANREQILSIVESMYAYNLSKISEARNIDYEHLRALSDSLVVRNANQAKAHGLIDDVFYWDQLVDKIKTDLELPAEEKVNLLGFGKYHKSKRGTELDREKGDKVAVVVGEGEIMSGSSTGSTMGSATIMKALRKVRADSSVKAVVLRINSPGGSALASDLMWREVMLTKKYKPVYASMSSVAASGGYYMAMGCDKIVAQPNTITGSIGVFGILLNAENFLKNKLGISVDRIKTGPFADIGTTTRDITPQDSTIIQEEINRIYETFTQKAADGRSMEIADLLEVASGRVWTGLQGLENGLVDTLGGLNETVEMVARDAGIENYKVAYYPKSTGFLQHLDKNDLVKMQSEMLTSELRIYYETLHKLERITHLEKFQARLPYDMVIE